MVLALFLSLCIFFAFLFLALRDSQMWSDILYNGRKKLIPPKRSEYEISSSQPTSRFESTGPAPLTQPPTVRFMSPPTLSPDNVIRNNSFSQVFLAKKRISRVGGARNASNCADEAPESLIAAKIERRKEKKQDVSAVFQAADKFSDTWSPKSLDKMFEAARSPAILPAKKKEKKEKNSTSSSINSTINSTTTGLSSGSGSSLEFKIPDAPPSSSSSSLNRETTINLPTALTTNSNSMFPSFNFKFK